MHIDIHDMQVVGEYETPVFTVLAQGINDTVFVITNAGVNTLNYRFQESTGSAWVDCAGAGSALYSSLLAGQSKTVTIASQAAHLRLVANASGGSALQFSIIRNQVRAPGGAIPIVGF